MSADVRKHERDSLSVLAASRPIPASDDNAGSVDRSRRALLVGGLAAASGMRVFVPLLALSITAATGHVALAHAAINATGNVDSNSLVGA